MCDNEWHHYAFVNDTAQRKCFFYSDGVLNFGIDSYSYSDFVCDSCRIGRSEESSNSGPYLFDDFRVYTTALKSLYIQTLARMYSNPGKRIPYLHYSFDSWTTGTTIRNEGYSGSFQNGTLMNDASVLSNSPVTGTNYLNLDAKYSQYVHIPSITLSGNSWALCFWYKKTPGTVCESDVPVFTMTSVLNYSTNEVTVGFYSTTGYLYLKEGESIVQFSSTDCTDGVWRHVSIIYNKDSCIYSFYLNGMRCSKRMTGSGIGNDSVRHVCYIGRSTRTCNEYEYATITIDDFRI